MSNVANTSCDCCLQLFDEVGFPFGDQWRTTNPPTIVCAGYSAADGSFVWASADYIFRSPTTGRPIANNVLTAGQAWKVSTNPHFQTVTSPLPGNVQLGDLRVDVSGLSPHVEAGAVSGVYYELAYQTDGTRKWQLFKCDDTDGFTLHADTGYVTTDSVGFRYANGDFHALTASQFKKLFSGDTYTPHDSPVVSNISYFPRWYQNASTGKFVYMDTKPSASGNYITVGAYGGSPVYTGFAESSSVGTGFNYVLDDADNVWISSGSSGILFKTAPPYTTTTQYNLGYAISGIHLCADGNLIILGPSGRTFVGNPTGGRITKLDSSDGSEIWSYTPGSYDSQAVVFVGDDLLTHVQDLGSTTLYPIRLNGSSGVESWRVTDRLSSYAGFENYPLYHPASNELIYITPT